MLISARCPDQAKFVLTAKRLSASKGSPGFTRVTAIGLINALVAEELSLPIAVLSRGQFGGTSLAMHLGLSMNTGTPRHTMNLLRLPTLAGFSSGTQ